MEKIIEVSNLTKQYKELKAIDNLSLEVKEGEILGLLRTKWKWEDNYNELYLVFTEFRSWNDSNFWKRNDTQ